MLLICKDTLIMINGKIIRCNYTLNNKESQDEFLLYINVIPDLL